MSKSFLLLFFKKEVLPYFFCLPLLAAQAHAESILERVRHSGQLRCGVVAEQADFDKRDAHGNLTAFATDMCRAVAAAVLGGQAGLALIGFPDAPHGLDAIRAGKIDVLYGVTPRADWAWRNHAAYGRPVFFDGQGVMVHAGSGITGLAGLADKQICFIGNTQNERVLTRTLQHRNIPFKPFPFEETGEMEAALVTGHCQAETGDVSALADGRAGFHGRQHDFDILPDRLTLDPFAPAMPANDTDWARAVDATLSALVQAEILGITQANVAQREQSQAADDQALLRRRGSGFTRGLPDGWANAVIRTVGNYGELYNRHLGDHAPMRLPRGLNLPWSQGGMLWAEPFE